MLNYKLRERFPTKRYPFVSIKQTFLPLPEKAPDSYQVLVSFENHMVVQCLHVVEKNNLALS